MADEDRASSGGRRDEVRADPAEVAALGTYLDLAREIKREVERIATDDAADVQQLVDAIDQFSVAERRAVTSKVFERLPSDVQWAILERVFDDDELRTYLVDEHERRAARSGRSGARMALAEAAGAARRLDTTEIADGDQVAVGLFRESDVRAAIARGSRSDACTRRLVLRRDGDAFRVIEDVFNPRGGYFVTAEYDRAAWVVDRFESHQTISIGAAVDGADGAAFEPVVYAGGRLDFLHDGAVLRGRLHLGFVMLEDIDVFAGQR